MSDFNCENCIHRDVCGIDVIFEKKGCEDFKDESLFIELPCKVGDTVYIADHWGKKVQEFHVNWFTITDNGVYCWEYRDSQPITPDIWGKTVFLTPEEAEQALKEANKDV